MPALLFIGSLIATLATDDAPGGRAAAEYAALVKEHEAAMAEWRTLAPGATPADPAWLDRYLKNPDCDFAPRFIAFAEANPGEATAVDAALRVLVMGRARDREIFPHYVRARDFLMGGHVLDAKVVRTMLSRATFDAFQTEPYFRALLAASDDRDTLARACMALARCHEARCKIAARPYFDHPEDDAKYPVATKVLNEHHDPDYIRYFHDTDAPALSRECQALFDRVVREFADVPLAPPWSTPEVKTRAEGRTLGKLAGEKLAALRSVAVGMPAPEIEGTAVDGAPLRLGDHRGKVVVLVFWGTWCGPCMALLPTEKALAERLKDRPFVLLGVNSDKDREAVQKASVEKGIAWRSWFDGGSPYGPISSRWDVHGWPTIVVIDKAGVIRFKDLPHHAPGPLNEAVDALLEEE